jgi:hypothetical protein
MRQTLPKATGARTATLSLKDSVPGSPQLIPLGGTANDLHLPLANHRASHHGLLTSRVCARSRHFPRSLGVTIVVIFFIFILVAVVFLFLFLFVFFLVWLLPQEEIGSERAISMA